MLNEDEQIRFRAILKFTEELMKHANLLVEQIWVVRKKYLKFEDIHRIKTIFEEYDRLCSWISEIESLKNIKRMLSSPPRNFLYDSEGRLKSSFLIYDHKEHDEALSSLEMIIRNCSVIVTVLNDLLKPEIPPKLIDELNSLKRALDELENKLSDEYSYVTEDIREAITEYEHGHHLASALIASRIICFALDQIPGDNDNEKLNTLIEKGIIKKDRKDEQQAFLRASRLSRNFLSHRPSIRPRTEEALSLISSAITFCRYLTFLG